MKSGNRQLIREVLTHVSLLNTLGRLMQQCTTSMLIEIGPIMFTSSFFDCYPNKFLHNIGYVFLLSKLLIKYLPLALVAIPQRSRSLFVEIGILTSLKDINTSFTQILDSRNRGAGFIVGDLTMIPMVIDIIEGSKSPKDLHGLIVSMWIALFQSSLSYSSSYISQTLHKVILAVLAVLLCLIAHIVAERNIRR